MTGSGARRTRAGVSAPHESLPERPHASVEPDASDPAVGLSEEP